METFSISNNYYMTLPSVFIKPLMWPMSREKLCHVEYEHRVAICSHMSYYTVFKLYNCFKYQLSQMDPRDELPLADVGS